jgi:hypothetical protein
MEINETRFSNGHNASRPPQSQIQPDDLPPDCRRAYRLLQQSAAYASELGRSPWDFAVELGSILGAGCTPSDLRWMVCRGLIRHGREIRERSSSRRRFTPVGSLSFEPRSCFVLADQDVALDDGADSEIRDRRRPLWDERRRALLVGPKIVKQFRLPSPNQVAILSAFQEEDWPNRIDDPLPPRPEVDPKRRLHDTIKSLNRYHKSRLLRFSGDGTGEGVTWAVFY